MRLLSQVITIHDQRFSLPVIDSIDKVNNSVTPPSPDLYPHSGYFCVKRRCNYVNTESI